MVHFKDVCSSFQTNAFTGGLANCAGNIIQEIAFKWRTWSCSPHVAAYNIAGAGIPLASRYFFTYLVGSDCCTSIQLDVCMAFMRLRIGYCHRGLLILNWAGHLLGLVMNHLCMEWPLMHIDYIYTARVQLFLHVFCMYCIVNNWVSRPLEWLE